MDSKRVFISGPMSGIKDYNKPAFDEAERKLRAVGFSVFNPAWMNFDKGWDNKSIADIDLAALSHCDYIYQLEGWESSQGATAEWQAAQWMGIESVNKSWLDWYVNEMWKRKDPEKRCNTCEHYLGLYGLEGRDYCWEHRCTVIWNEFCDNYILKGEKKDEEEKEVNEDKM